MKFKITSILILIPIICVSQLDSLKGKIKSVYDTVTYTQNYNHFLILREFDFGQGPIHEDDLFTEFKGDLLPKRTLFSNNKKEFDTTGRLVKLTIFHRNTSYFYTTYYVYDENNNLVRVSEYSNDIFSSRKDTRYRFFRDSVYRRTVEVSYNDEPEYFSMTQYFYDDHFRLAVEKESNSFEDVSSINFAYNFKGNVIRRTYSKLIKNIRFDTLRGVSTIIDSADDYNTKEFSYYPDGSLKEEVSGCIPSLLKSACERKRFVYENGRIKTIYFQWMDTIFSRREYEYNPDSTIKTISRFFKDESISENYVEYFYKNKELYKAIYMYPDKKAEIEFQYKLDAKNNWIEQTQYINGKPTYIRKRVIEYW